MPLSPDLIEKKTAQRNLLKDAEPDALSVIDPDRSLSILKRRRRDAYLAAFAFGFTGPEEDQIKMWQTIRNFQAPLDQLDNRDEIGNIVRNEVVTDTSFAQKRWQLDNSSNPIFRETSDELLGMWYPYRIRPSSVLQTQEVGIRFIEEKVNKYLDKNPLETAVKTAYLLLHDHLGGLQDLLYAYCHKLTIFNAQPGDKMLSPEALIYTLTDLSWIPTIDINNIEEIEDPRIGKVDPTKYGEWGHQEPQDFQSTSGLGSRLRRETRSQPNIVPASPYDQYLKVLKLDYLTWISMTVAEQEKALNHAFRMGALSTHEDRKLENGITSDDPFKTVMEARKGLGKIVGLPIPTVQRPN